MHAPPAALASPVPSHEGDGEEGAGAAGEGEEHAEDAMGTVDDIAIDDDDALVVSPPQTHVRDAGGVEWVGRSTDR